MTWLEDLDSLIRSHWNVGGEFLLEDINEFAGDLQAKYPENRSWNSY